MILATILSWAVVTLSSSFMRQSADYESPLENQMLMGALVETFESDRYWVKVKAEDYTGWVTDLGLKVLTDEEKDAYLEAPKWICTVAYTSIREEPSAGAPQLTDFTMGNLVRQTGNSKCCWVEVLLPDGRRGWVRKNCVKDFKDFALGAAPTRENITELAKQFLGTPYMWGGNSAKHFDCSGLVKLCYFMNGLLLPRNASQQFRCGEPVADGKWQPGDLLFFGKTDPVRVSHVAIYLGDGKIIHSSHLVRINTLEEYGRDPVGAVRIIGNEGKGAVAVKDSPYYFRQDGGKE